MKISQLLVLSLLIGCTKISGLTGAANMASGVPIDGPLCGSKQIRGRVITEVEGSGACGIANPVRVTQVGGITLSTPARINCGTARTLLQWVQNGAIPAVGRQGGGIKSMNVMASYSCRTRNSRQGARLSEHSYGNAIDIGGVTLNDGSRVNVLRDWRNGTAANARILRQMHKAACGPFGTVLGPESDSHHQNHFHFDTADYRNGSYCR